MPSMIFFDCEYICQCCSPSGFPSFHDAMRLRMSVNETLFAGANRATGDTVARKLLLVLMLLLPGGGAGWWWTEIQRRPPWWRPPERCR
ncbi:MAG: hypothetical protein R3C49_04425 [Planctomycetaceae bacterium]